MNMNFAKFPTPVLGRKTHELYDKLYGENGARFIDILDTSPDEIAVISRLIAYLKDQNGGSKNGHSEDS